MKRKIIEVKDGDEVQYVSFDAYYSSRPDLVDNIIDATDFTNKKQELEQALRRIDLKTATFQAFSSIKVDEINIVEVEVSVVELSRVSA